MAKIFNIGNPNYKSPNNCSDISPVTADLRDRTGTYCNDQEKEPCQTVGRKKVFGIKANCDPIQAGTIINDISSDPKRRTIYRYANSMRGTDQAMLDLFKNVVVLDEDSHPHPVPIIWGTQEKAVAWVLQNNARKDNSLVVDRIPLPLLAIHQSGVAFDQSRFIYHKAQAFIANKQKLYQTELKPNDTIYGITKGIPIDVNYTLYAWTMYIEDMNQILEQIMLKFSPIAYIQVQEVFWEIHVLLDGVENNIDFEPGDKKERVIKYKFNLKVQTYIPQPVTRNKTVLNIKTDFFNTTSDEMTEVFDRQEVSAND